MPILFRSCLGLGFVPKDLPSVRWIPVDVAARVLLKQTFNSKENGRLEYFHVENSTATPWLTIAEGVSKYSGGKLPLISMGEWIGKIKELGIKEAERIPAVSLVEFFEELEESVGLNVAKTLEIAAEVDYGLVMPSLITRYLDYQADKV